MRNPSLDMRVTAAFSFIVAAAIVVSATPPCFTNSDTLAWYVDAVGETPCM